MGKFNDNSDFSLNELRKAWSRFLNDRYTNQDISFIRESLKDDNSLDEFYDISEKEWQLSSIVELLEKEKSNEAAKKEAAEILTEYRKKQSNKPDGKAIKGRNRFRSVYIAVASILLLCSLVSVLYYFVRQSPQPEIQYIEILTERGTVKTVFLPDSSKVVLNANSRIRYPDIFGPAKRTVELTGEALFEITTDVDRPFIVKAQEATVQVLGTVFNVKAYDEDNLQLITVASGKVLVNQGNESVTLTADEQLKYDKTTKLSEILTVDADKFVSWVDGTLYFNRTPIREVVNMLNRYYPKLNIELAEGNYSNLISGEHDNKRVEAVITSIIYSTGLHYKQENNTIIFYQPK